MEESQFEDTDVLSESFQSSSDSASERDFDEDLNLIGDTDSGEIKPYMFEPELSPSSSDDEDLQQQQPDDEAQDRRVTTDWCTCGNCRPLDKQEECVCCQEIDRVKQRIDEAPGEIKPRCITQHPGFNTVVLDHYVLQAAYFGYRQAHGPQNFKHNRQFRYVAYRQLCRWCWEWLGKHIRVILPACAVHKILNAFPLAPGETRTGYRDHQ